MTSDADDRQLLRRWHENADEEARAALVERSCRSPAAGAPLRQQGRDARRPRAGRRARAGQGDRPFDLDARVRFTTFAVPTIAGEIKRHFRDRGWMIRVPRDVQELSARLTMPRERLARELGRSPTVGSSPKAAQSGIEQVLEALGAADAYRALSLDEPLGEGIEDALDAIGGDDAGFERVEQRQTLRSGLAHLPAREREILRLRFYEGLTQREIADRVGVSQMHVSRLIRRSIESLRKRAGRRPSSVQAA